ncbi:hypothetical protein D3C72_1581030 [compost metagenome]
MQPLQVGHQGAVASRALARQGLKQCGGVRHLRHLSGGDEGAHLDPLQAAVGEAGDQLKPLFERQDAGLVLQPVPRAHLYQAHPIDRYPMFSAHDALSCLFSPASVSASAKCTSTVPWLT